MVRRLAACRPSDRISNADPQPDWRVRRTKASCCYRCDAKADRCRLHQGGSEGRARPLAKYLQTHAPKPNRCTAMHQYRCTATTITGARECAQYRKTEGGRANAVPPGRKSPTTPMPVIEHPQTERHDHGGAQFLPGLADTGGLHRAPRLTDERNEMLLESFIDFERARVEAIAENRKGTPCSPF